MQALVLVNIVHEHIINKFFSAHDILQGGSNLQDIFTLFEAKLKSYRHVQKSETAKWNDQTKQIKQAKRPKPRNQNKMTAMTKTKPLKWLRWVEDKMSQKM